MALIFLFVFLSTFLSVFSFFVFLSTFSSVFSFVIVSVFVSNFQLCVDGSVYRHSVALTGGTSVTVDILPLEFYPVVDGDGGGEGGYWVGV